MLTLDKFEEASEKVKEVTLETKLVYSDFLSEQTGNKVYLKPENITMHHCISRKSCAGCCLRCKMLWLQSCHRDADNNTFDQSKPYQELWR